MNYSLLLPAALLLATPAFAQSGHQGHDMPAAKAEPDTPPPSTDPHAGHDMGEAEAPPVAEEPAAEAVDPHAGHDMSTTEMPSSPAKQPSDPDPHAGHDMGAKPGGAGDEAEVGNAPAPAPPGDHAADTIFGGGVMARSRKELAYEVGGMGYSLVMIDLLEVGFQKGRESYRFEGEAFTGDNINRFGIKFEGEGGFSERIDDLELQALYSRAIAPYWNLQAGVRYDIKPDPSRTYLVAGVEGIAPYWFKVNAATFLSNKGEVRARLEASYDQRITQSLILQPRIEANLAFQDIRAIGVGAGLTDFEAGLRLRYEIKQEVAPYIGVEWSKKTGATARFSRLAGDDPDTISLVAGIRIWF